MTEAIFVSEGQRIRATVGKETLSGTIIKIVGGRCRVAFESKTTWLEMKQVIGPDESADAEEINVAPPPVPSLTQALASNLASPRKAIQGAAGTFSRRGDAAWRLVTQQPQDESSTKYKCSAPARQCSRPT